MKALIFGAGRIGCGFAGHLLRAAGYDLVFVCRDEATADHFNRVGRYVVRLVDANVRTETVVDGIRAVLLSDDDGLRRELLEADVVATAVGCANLRSVAPAIAAGLSQRTRPVNVLAFENFGTADACLRGFIAGCLGGRAREATASHGFSGALVSRIVAQRLGDVSRDEPLVFVGDPYDTFVVDGRRLVGPLPVLPGMIVTRNFDAWVQRKLFTFSAGHATTAYLGNLKGYHYIHTAIRDPEIRDAALGAMREGQQGLRARYGEEIAGTEADLDEIVSRFGNATLNDSIDRVGRDPVRKLGARDRLVGSARLARRAGIRPEKLMLAVAAAMFFCPRSDPSASRLLQEIRASGPGPALNRLSGIDPEKTLGRLAIHDFCRISDTRNAGGLLLSLKNFFWA